MPAHVCVCVLVSLVFRALCKFLEIEPFVAFPSCACLPACRRPFVLWGICRNLGGPGVLGPG